MGQLFDMRTKIDAHIAKKKLDLYKIRGQLTLQCGFVLGFVTANSVDDPKQVASLKKASKVLLDLDL